MQQFNIDGHIIAYESQSGPRAEGTLLFIHGSGGDHLKWDGLMKQVHPNLVRVAIDLPGHGSSPGPLLKTIDAAAALVRKIPALLNLPRPIFLVGHSMGSAIAMSIALDYGAEIDGLILIGAGSRLRVLPTLLEALRAGQKDPAFFKLGFAPDTPTAIVDAELLAYEQIPAELLLNDFTACDHFDRSKDVANIKLPALLIVGEKDQLTPVKYAQLLHDNIPQSNLVVISQAGHYVMLEKATEVSQAIEDFLLKVAANSFSQ